MLKWEYCILSGIETSLNRKFSVSLTFSSSEQEKQSFEIKLDSDRSEEMFTTQCLGKLGRQGWEVVAFNRAVAKFEAVLKRPMDLNQAALGIPSGMN
jgi:hypothetical protein